MSLKQHALRLLLPALALALHAGAAGAAPPAVKGRLVAADGGSPAGMRVFARGGVFADSADVDASGRFSLALPAGPAGDTVEIVVDAAVREARLYHPALVRVPRRELEGEQVFVLVPRVWTIPGGAYAGARVEISLERAFRPVCGDCSAFFRRDRARGAAGRDLVRTWPEETFPLRVAFDREDSGGPITRGDSVSFWRAVGEIEEVFGSDLFRPVPFRETVPREDYYPDDVILVQADPSLRYSGLGISSSFGNEIVYGEVRLKRASLDAFDDGAHLVAHEMMHALGLGHTCSWRTVLADARCPGMRVSAPSPEDVAHSVLARRVRELQRAHGARWGLRAGLAGEREVVLGLPAETVEG